MKLVSSGSLLVVAAERSAEAIASQLRRQGTKATIIGKVLPNRAKRILVKRNGLEEKLPLPLADDLWTALRRRV